MKSCASKSKNLGENKKLFIFRLTPTPETLSMNVSKKENNSKNTENNEGFEFERSVVKNVTTSSYDEKKNIKKKITHGKNLNDIPIQSSSYTPAQKLTMFQQFILRRKKLHTKAPLVSNKTNIIETKIEIEKTKSETISDYGQHLRPGEGAAMAAFVKNDKRIPRRGEVGLTADQIEKFENVGYVMSGSRHVRMNAIRMRKENQVYTAEERAALIHLNYEEKKVKEKKSLGTIEDSYRKIA
eukprot:gnl/TRDRNA2_/TRDRNA2_175266_c0_seq2.p1 gnl/TRDRNA2_/TRDRNA2_175266_c0~~gnl/TRDRNA2_/TRDRNA2_175266_c0_seq2.p1  ORF type:complete len:241 (+),score=14.68 gnl/TRDRNA2_/TRDRNA2_175266_c0_seq2:93-815(+)